MLKNPIYVLVIALTLAACGSTGTHIKDDGTSDQLYWHKPESTLFNNKHGTFPTLDQLQQIRSGMTKDQLYNLIGRPHFNEGLRVREWSYLFHFHTPKKGVKNLTTCQYKILFDKKQLAQNFYWKAIEPVNAVCPVL